MLKPFDRVDAIAVPIDALNVDTDQLTPIHRIASVQRVRPDYATSLFYDQRFDAAGNERGDFVLNQRPFRDAKIMVTADNFGCGSSRETAVWALSDFGIRAIIGPSFGDIFFQNCSKNGLLPIRLDPLVCATIRRQLHATPGARIVVDLLSQTVIAPDGLTVQFEIDAFRKLCLLRGADDITITADYSDDIDAWERRRDHSQPWAASVTDPANSSGPITQETTT